MSRTMASARSSSAIAVGPCSIMMAITSPLRLRVPHPRGEDLEEEIRDYSPAHIDFNSTSIVSVFS
jgi:hypothetical protein